MDGETHGESSPALPEPEVLSCYFDSGFSPPLAAMRLAWPGARSAAWELPGGLRLEGPPPECFGLRIERYSLHQYAVCLVWNGLCVRWGCLTAEELTAGSLGEVLAAMKSDLRYLLAQPVSPYSSLSTAAA